MLDQSGAAIPGATLTVTDVQRGTSRTLTTDSAGAYNAPNLLPGTYTVRAEFKGFKTFERQNVPLEVAGDVRVDLTLQPGEQTQAVNVTEAVPLIETNNAELGGTLQNEVINDLPLNGRNFENLIDLHPGVSKYPGNSGWTNSFNGGRPHDNYFMVDGINSNDPWMAQSMMNAVMAGGDAGTILPIDAIDEFKTQQNPGRNTAGSRAPSLTLASSPAATRFMGPLTPTAAMAPGMPWITSQRPAARRPRSNWSSLGAASAARSKRTNYSISPILSNSATALGMPLNMSFRSRRLALDRQVKI